jgi:hypothetical protein
MPDEEATRRKHELLATEMQRYFFEIRPRTHSALEDGHRRLGATDSTTTGQALAGAGGSYQRDEPGA